MLCNNLHRVLLLLMAGSLHVNGDGDVNITELLIREGIVPDVIHEAPTQLLRCVFPHGILKPGDVLNMYQCNLRPRINYTYEPNAHYAIMMIGITKWNQSRHLKRPFCIDPALYANTKSPIKYRQSVQWFVVNIPENRIDEGKTRIGYLPSIHVLEKTIPERFLILLYKQNKTFDFDHPPTRFVNLVKHSIPRERAGTRMYVNTLDFIREYFFTNQAPLAANYYDAEIFSQEDPEFDSLDYRVMRTVEKQRSIQLAEGVNLRTESFSIDYEALFA